MIHGLRSLHRALRIAVDWSKENPDARTVPVIYRLDCGHYLTVIRTVSQQRLACSPWEKLECPECPPIEAPTPLEA